MDQFLLFQVLLFRESGTAGLSLDVILLREADAGKDLLRPPNMLPAQTCQLIVETGHLSNHCKALFCLNMFKSPLFYARFSF